MDATFISGLIFALRAFNRTEVPLGEDGCLPHDEYLDKVLSTMKLCQSHRDMIKEAVLMEKK